MTYIVLKAPLNSNQPTNRAQFMRYSEIFVDRYCPMLFTRLRGTPWN